MYRVPHAPLKAPRALAARWIAPAGAPEPRVTARAGAAVLSLPGRYSMTHLLLSPDAVAVVDAGSVTDVPRILQSLQWLGRALSDVKAVVISHLHFDHVMGVDELARLAGCPVAVSRRAFDAFHGGAPLKAPDALRSTGAFLTGWALQGFPALAPEDLPRLRRMGFMPTGNPLQADLVPLDDGAPLPGFPGWTSLFAPGHSEDAHCLFHREAGFLVTGDTVRNYLGGEWNPIQADPEAYGRTRERLQGLPVRTVFPGHGPVLEGEGILGRLKVLAPHSLGL